MSLNTEIYDGCRAVIMGKGVQRIALSGRGKSAIGKARVYLARANQTFDAVVKSRHDKAANVLLLGLKADFAKLERAKPKPKNIPDDLFAFINGAPVSPKSFQEIREFSVFLESLLNQSKGDEIVPEFDDEKII